MSEVPVRWRPEGFELKCSTCLEWVTLTLEDWTPKNGMKRCRACWNAYHAAHERGRNQIESIAAAKREAGKVRYQANKARYNAAAKAWRDAHRPEIAAYNKAYRAKNARKLRRQAAAYYEDAREVILMKKRITYKERAA